MAATLDPRDADAAARVTPIVFDLPGDWASSAAAVRALHGAGFAVGGAAHPSPRGIAWGNFLVGKWYTLSQTERRALDGELHEGRHGPAEIVIAPDAPPHVLDAWDRVRAAAERAVAHG